MNLSRRNVLHFGLSGLSLLMVRDGHSFATENPEEKQKSTAGRASLQDSTYVASVAMHSVMGDPEENLDRIEQWCRKAHSAGARFAVFPEKVF